MKKILAVALCVVALSGCTPHPTTSKEPAVVVTKTRPLSTPEQKVVQDSVRQELKDPQSATFKMLPINEDGAPGTYCGMVNAKNSFGGYVGDTPFMATVTRRAGEVVSSFAMLPDSSQFGRTILLDMCAKKGYLL